MAGLSEQDLSRLEAAVRRSRQDLSSAREDYRLTVEQVAGPDARYWLTSPGYLATDAGRRDRRPYNLLALWMEIIQRNLIASNPRVSVWTSKPELKQVARSLELLNNQRIEKMNLGRTLEAATANALMLTGIVKVCIADDGDIGTDNDGSVFCDIVDWFDWVHDTSADRRNDRQFEGHRYRVPLSWAKGNKRFSAEARAKLADSGPFDPSDESRWRERARDKSFERMIELWELWLPTRNTIVTFAGTPKNILLEQEWTGPRNGPYHHLEFMPIPTRDIPAAPARFLKDMADLASRMFVKLGRQADRQKDFGVYRGANQEDAERMKNADDGEIVRADSGGAAIERVSLGGVNGPTLAALMQITNMFSYQAGNLDMLGGLSPQSGTVGQDRLLANSASQKLQAMQQKELAFVSGIVEAVSFFLWDDPALDELLVQTYDTQAGRIELPYRFTSSDKKGDFIDYNLRIEPNSLQQRTPSERAAAMIQMVQQVIMPLYPLMQQQGMGINVDQFIRNIAKNMDLPEMAESIVFAGSPPDSQQIQPPDSNGSQHTTREYVRKNIPGAARQQQHEMIAQMALGGNKQPSEMASIVRPAG